MMNQLIKIVSHGDNLYSANEKSGKDIGLAFDYKTKVVYHMFYESHFSNATTTYSGYMAPYISENGKFCRFIDNQIVEIG